MKSPAKVLHSETATKSGVEEEEIRGWAKRAQESGLVARQTCSKQQLGEFAALRIIITAAIS